MKAKYNNPLAVNVKSQKEWDFVSEKLGYKWNIPDGYLPKHKTLTCINLMYQSFCDIEYYKSNNYTILSFEEWLKIMGDDNPFKPRVRVRVFTRSNPVLYLVTVKNIGVKWYEDTSNKYEILKTNQNFRIALTVNNYSKQQNYFYNYRYE